MPKVYEKREFHSFDDRDSSAIFSDIEFRECYFEGCCLSVTNDPQLRTTFKNIRLINCSQRGTSLEAAVFEDVVVDNFNTHGQLVQTFGAVFNRVVLRGKLDRLMVSSCVDLFGERPSVQQAFDEAKEEFYRNVEWAIDISRGEFKELDIRGIPACLIRRDPETQVVVTRERAILGEWDNLPLHDTLWPFVIKMFLESDEPDVVLVAPKRHRNFRKYLEDLKTLQKAGVADPD